MKKGFTLVELLAVIVILAIVSLITVPVVNKMINSSKNETYEMSVKNYVKAVETALYRNDLTSETIANGTYQIKSNGDICLDETCTNTLEVDTDGERPTGGIIQIQNNKVISITDLIYSQFIASIDNNGEIAIMEKKDNELDDDSGMTDEDTEETWICQLSSDAIDDIIDEDDIVICGTESFYVMNSDETTTTMLSMYNLNVGNIFTYNSSDDQNLRSIKNPTGLQDIQMIGCNTGTYCIDEENMLGSVYYGVLSKQDAAIAISEYATKLRTLLGITTQSDLITSMITGAQLESFGCSEYDATSCNYSWLFSTSYWVNDETYDIMEFTGIWNRSQDYAIQLNPEVDDDVSYISGHDADLLFGARPVVTISNEYIK